MPDAFKRIGLLDHMGMGNMGNAAIQEAFIACIKIRLPNADLVAFSLNPLDTKKRHNIVSYPIRWSYPGWNNSEVRLSKASGLQSRLKRFLRASRIFYVLIKPVHDCVRELVHL